MKLEEIKALCEAATPGPWEVVGVAMDGVPVIQSPVAGPYRYKIDGSTPADAAFIAAMRSLAPRMLAVCEAALEILRRHERDVHPDKTHLQAESIQRAIEYTLKPALAALEAETP